MAGRLTTDKLHGATAYRCEAGDLALLVGSPVVADVDDPDDERQSAKRRDESGASSDLLLILHV